MNCEICGFELTLSPTDYAPVKVCAVCNTPYMNGAVHMPEEYLPILKKFWKNKKSNVVPDAMCLMTSTNSRTTDEHRAIYYTWYLKNKKMFPKVETSVTGGPPAELAPEHSPVDINPTK